MSVKLWLFMKMLLGASLFLENFSEMIVKKPTEQKRAVHMKLSLRKLSSSRMLEVCIRKENVIYKFMLLFLLQVLIII